VSGATTVVGSRSSTATSRRGCQFRRSSKVDGKQKAAHSIAMAVLSRVYFFPLSDAFVNVIRGLSPELGALLPTSEETVTAVVGMRYEEPEFEAIADAVLEQGMALTRRTIRRYHLSLKSRGFVVLSGVSGTGKTWIAQAYARAVGAKFLIVPVAPNWTTNEDLLGYRSPIDDKYRDTPFSLFLRQASNEWTQSARENRPAQPYHVILDEMNLARVEYYFAKFLSAMELSPTRGRCRCRARTKRLRDTRAEPPLHRHRQHRRDDPPVR
jgi:hypothetical protein